MHKVRVGNPFVLYLIFTVCHGVLLAQAPKTVTESQPPPQKTDGLVRQIMGPGDAPQPFPEANTIPQPSNEQELAAATKRLADELAAAGRFAGSILLVADGETLVDNAGGEADRAAKVSNTTETAYDVGSIGKLFTQIAILQLAEGGKLSLDDNIGKHLTDYPDSSIASKVTVRQLLLHTSGIPDFFSHITPETKLDSILELGDFLPFFARKPLDFEPGSDKRYSSSGYIVIGLVIEAVSGEKYAAYAQHHILEPARMTHTGFFDRTHLPPLSRVVMKVMTTLPACIRRRVLRRAVFRPRPAICFAWSKPSMPASCSSPNRSARFGV
ncbi:MAG: beta-lactamase family protein [Chthoniobacterales bacterium]|nr:beta-lactamase family protein [Chthoniobacterales bacterium]